jgi:hypothetical protein
MVFSSQLSLKEFEPSRTPQHPPTPGPKFISVAPPPPPQIYLRRPPIPLPNNIGSSKKNFTSLYYNLQRPFFHWSRFYNKSPILASGICFK